jgi:hypothetical protein
MFDKRAHCSACGAANPDAAREPFERESTAIASTTRETQYQPANKHQGAEAQLALTRSASHGRITTYTQESNHTASAMRAPVHSTPRYTEPRQMVTYPAQAVLTTLPVSIAETHRQKGFKNKQPPVYDAGSAAIPYRIASAGPSTASETRRPGRKAKKDDEEEEEEEQFYIHCQLYTQNLMIVTHPRHPEKWTYAEQQYFHSWSTCFTASEFEEAGMPLLRYLLWHSDDYSSRDPSEFELYIDHYFVSGWYIDGQPTRITGRVFERPRLKDQLRVFPKKKGPLPSQEAKIVIIMAKDKRVHSTYHNKNQIDSDSELGDDPLDEAEVQRLASYSRQLRRTEELASEPPSEPTASHSIEACEATPIKKEPGPSWTKRIIDPNEDVSILDLTADDGIVKRISRPKTSSTKALLGNKGKGIKAAAAEAVNDGEVSAAEGSSRQLKRKMRESIELTTDLSPRRTRNSGKRRAK